MLTTQELYKTTLKNYWISLAAQPLYLSEKIILQKALENASKNIKIIEAGTGSGRIAFRLSDQLYTDITAYDYVDEYIQSAKKIGQNQSKNIDFCTHDATNLRIFWDNSFDIAIYLQQIISAVPTPQIPAALAEAHRILKPGGRLVISFLNYDSRWYNPLLSFGLGLRRFFTPNHRHQYTRYDLPFLKIVGKPNFSFFNTNQATNRWATRAQIHDWLSDADFKNINIIAMPMHADTLAKSDRVPSFFYVICDK